MLLSIERAEPADSEPRRKLTLFIFICLAAVAESVYDWNTGGFPGRVDARKDRA
jgi:hypothetical protein